MNPIYPKIRPILAQKGISVNEIAVFSGINIAALWLKLWGILPWNLTEVVNICVFLKDSDITKIFVQLDNKTI